MNKTFNQYHEENPEIYQEFKRITFRLIDSGRDYYGAKGIIEIIRFNTITGAEGYKQNREFKINNNFAPDYARKFMNDYPLYNEFFRTRQLKKVRQ
jgi:hypothetical protein